MANQALYGLQSFDDSSVNGPAGITMGNAGHLTFGTMAESFDESREDNERRNHAARKPYGVERNVLDGIREEDGWGNSLDKSADESRASRDRRRDEQQQPGTSRSIDHAESKDDESTIEQTASIVIVDELEDPGAWVEKQRKQRKASSKANESAVSTGADGHNGQMTLREQEKVIDELKKENFSLKLKIHFYSQRLEQLAPSHLDAALRENVQLKVEFQTLRNELKRYKKLLLEGNKAIEAVMKERDEAKQQLRTRGGPSSSSAATSNDLEAKLAETERKWREEREKRRQLRDSLGNDDLQAEIQHLHSELDQLRDAHEEALGEADDLRRQLRSGNLDDPNSHLGRRLQELEQDNATLRAQLSSQLSALSTKNLENEALREDVEALKFELEKVVDELERLEKIREREHGASNFSQIEKSREELEGENDHYRDRLAAAELRISSLEAELEEKEKEVEELLSDLETRDTDHAEALKAAEDEWAAEIDDLRAREAEARDLLVDKDRDVVELSERIEMIARELVHERADRAADAEEVVALTEDLKKLGAQIFALEEEAEDKDARIRDLVHQVESTEHRSSELDRAQAEIEHLRLTNERQDGDARRLGQSHSNDRRALEQQVDSLTREIRRLQAELSSSKSAQEDRARQVADVRDLERRLADETQTRLNITDKLDSKTKQLKDAQGELVEVKERLRLLEIQLKSDGRLRPRVGSSADSAGGAEPASPSGSSSSQVALLTTRANDAERRLAATQAQLADAENKLGEARTKVAIAEGKWEARVRELESRLKAAEEKVKRERQGAKERVLELQNEISNLEGQLSGAKRRDAQLGQVLQRAGADKTNQINSRNYVHSLSP